MKNIEVIENFINGDTKGNTQHLKIEDNNLINYTTVIARRINGKIYLNATKYSQTTSKIQNMIRKSTQSKLLIEVTSQEILNITEQKPITVMVEKVTDQTIAA